MTRHHGFLDGGSKVLVSANSVPLIVYESLDGLRKTMEHLARVALMISSATPVTYLDSNQLRGLFL